MTSPIQPVATASPTEQFPFSTREPEIYRAEIVISTAGTESKWGVARKGERWRIDFYDGGQIVRSLIRSDTEYTIDPANKTYSEKPAGGGSAAAYSGRFFRGREFRKFELLGRENGQARYRVVQPQGAGEIVITVDESSGLMIRQEFSARVGSNDPAVIYEMRGLALEVDDDVFSLPPDHRRVERPSGDGKR